MSNEEKYTIQMQGENGEKKERESPPPPPPPSPERKRDYDYEQERPLRESTDFPDLIEPEEGWDKE